MSRTPQQHPIRYEDFVVQLGPEIQAGIQVKAACAMAGEARGHLALAVTAARLVHLFAQAVRHGTAILDDPGQTRDFLPAEGRTSTATASKAARDFGSALFDAVFRGPVRSLFDRSLARLDDHERLGLRIRLQLDLADEAQLPLHSLPWELMYKTDSGDFLGLSRRTPVVRYLEIARAVRAPVPVDALRVLALAPAPADQPALDLLSERRDLEALSRRVPRLEVRFLETADLGALRRSLVARETQVLHLMGHADFDPLTGQGVICLEGSDGRTETVTAESLVSVVGDVPSLRLAVLNACNTARAGGSARTGAFSGLAPALMRAGLPAVVAMQLPISDAGAIAFSKTLYARLVEGDPLDAAVSEARQSLHALAPTALEWAVPTLFTRAPPESVIGAPWTEEGCRSAIQQLLAGNFDRALDELRREVAAMPNRGTCRVALGTALTRGRRLRHLPYRTALEMHRHFVEALSSADGRHLGGAALLALKLDYFDANSVREPLPTRERALEAVAGAAWSDEERRFLSCLAIGETTREALHAAGLPDWRK